MIEFRSSTDYELLNRLDEQTFLLDERPTHWADAHWMIGWIDGQPAAFCAWIQRIVPGEQQIDTEVSSEPRVGFPIVKLGFHYRGGVLPAYRGQGIQKTMFELREIEMLKRGITKAVTYTDADNAPSMRNLITMGYRPYTPDEYTCLSGGLQRLGRVGFVHWEKNLS